MKTSVEITRIKQKCQLSDVDLNIPFLIIDGNTSDSLPRGCWAMRVRSSGTNKDANIVVFADGNQDGIYQVFPALGTLKMITVQPLAQGEELTLTVGG